MAGARPVNATSRSLLVANSKDVRWCKWGAPGAVFAHYVSCKYARRAVPPSATGVLYGL